MMLRNSDNEYIEVEDVEVERQAKLFQAIGHTIGDFSYSFDVDNNSENLAKLGIPSPVDGFMKTIYTANDIDLCDNDGGVLYKGFVRVTGIDDQVISCSFFSGNNNWFNLMTGELKDIDLALYEVEPNVAAIINSWDDTEGVVFPIINTGAMADRSTNNWFVNDFHPFIYVKDVVKKCFDTSGLKLSGEILSDYRYNHLLTSNNSGTPEERIQLRRVFVGKSSPQTIDDDTPEKLTFPDVATPNYIGTLWNTGTDRFTADKKMLVNVTMTVTATHLIGEAVMTFVYINGAIYPFFYLIIGGPGTAAGTETKSINKQVPLNSGDYIEIFSRMRDPDDPGTVDSATLKIDIDRIYNIFPEQILPNVKMVDFVTDIFRIFNTVIDYDSFTKTVTVDFFKNAIRKDEVDLSEFIDPSTIKVNYTELLEAYGKSNILKYSEAGNEQLELFNETSILPYASGEITSDNDFVEDQVDIVESNFVATIENSLNPMGVSLPYLEWRQLERIGTEFTGTITNSSGAKVTVSDYNPADGDLIEITESTVESYIGQWTVGTVASGTEFYFVSMPYDANATVTMQVLTVESRQNEDQVLLLGEPSVPKDDFSDYPGFDINTTFVTEDALFAWFYRPMDGRPIDRLTSSLSFGDIPIENVFQRTMIEDYWADLGPIIKDPGKPYIDAYLPKPVFDSITFKQPLRIKCDKFNARFFPNRITGYKDSSQPCTLELIKLP